MNPIKPASWYARAWSRVPAGALAGFFLAIGLNACVNGSSLPGTALGNYQVVGKLVSNTCGSGVSADNPWDFTAELSQDDTALYLAHSDGSDEVSGELNSTDHTATLISAVTQNVSSSATSSGTCNLTLSTSFELTLDAKSPPQSFTGKATFTYSVATGISSTTDCTSQLSSSGGKYSTLPCTVQYSLTASRS